MKACEYKWWHLRLWKKGEAEPREGEKGLLRVRFRCGSWRHPGRCAVERSQEDFARIAAALEEARPEDVVFLVLTFDVKAWEEPTQAYVELKERWRSYAKALRREWGSLGYVATVEKTRKGWPHLNVIMVCPGMGRDMKVMPRYVRQWCKDTAASCKFGPAGTFVDVASSKAKVAGYIVKLADLECAGVEVDGKLMGEVVKTSQLPRNAPKNTRRLRSSKGFLPDLSEESEFTGALEMWPHPENLTPEQRERFDRWRLLMRWEQLSADEKEEARRWEAAVEAANDAEWKKVQQEAVGGRWTYDERGLRVELDASAPREAEWVDDSDWPRPVLRRAGSAERAEPEQQELF